MALEHAILVSLSERPASGLDLTRRFDRSIGSQAEVIDAWMERLGIARATFVAHDIGGATAQT